tara:strand:- start:212 stop:433 length:222 start_codon:yes stop_codon:yes gene_type:complete
MALLTAALLTTHHAEVDKDGAGGADEAIDGSRQLLDGGAAERLDAVRLFRVRVRVRARLGVRVRVGVIGLEQE